MNLVSEPKPPGHVMECVQGLRALLPLGRLAEGPWRSFSGAQFAAYGCPRRPVTQSGDQNRRKKKRQLKAGTYTAPVVVTR